MSTMSMMAPRLWLLLALPALACSTPRAPGAVPEDSRGGAEGEAPAEASPAPGPAAAEIEGAGEAAADARIDGRASPEDPPEDVAAATPTSATPNSATPTEATPNSATPTEAIDPLAAMVESTPRCPESVKHCVAITVHVARSADDGSLVQDAAWMRAQILAADQRFAEIDVGFEITAVTALPASQVAIVTRSDRDLLGRPHFSRGPIHVFVVGSLADVDNEGEFIRGVHWRDRADRERRWVILSSIAGSLVLTHELGHFFGLPHSSFPGSVMNKRDGTWAAPEERGFHPREIAKMRRGRDEMLASGMLTPRSKRARATKPEKPAP
ncbi:MAG: hypothetical protein R3B09_18050 [Nannocystaceae bacterium]